MAYYLNHVALYAKSHYKRTDVIQDLIKCLDADCFSFVTHKYEVLELLLNAFHSLVSVGGQRMQYIYRELIMDTSPENCWKIGYYTKDFPQNLPSSVNREDLPEYDYSTAFIMKILSFLRDQDAVALGGLTAADPNVLPLNK